MVVSHTISIILLYYIRKTQKVVSGGAFNGYGLLLAPNELYLLNGRASGVSPSAAVTAAVTAAAAAAAVSPLAAATGCCCALCLLFLK